LRDRHPVGVLAPRPQPRPTPAKVEEEDDEETPLLPDELSEGGAEPGKSACRLPRSPAGRSARSAGSWFAILISALSVPQATDKLAQLVDESWPVLERAQSREVMTAFRAIEQPPPVGYVFDQAGEKSGANRDQGIDDFDPYMAKTLSPSKPRFCVICQSAHKGRVEQFVRKFLEGITIHGQGRNPFGKSFIRKYAFKDVLLDFFEAADSTAAAYRRAVNKTLVAPPGIAANIGRSKGSSLPPCRVRRRRRSPTNCATYSYRCTSSNPRARNAARCRLLPIHRK
jgi:hypothetical protein